MVGYYNVVDGLPCPTVTYTVLHVVDGLVEGLTSHELVVLSLPDATEAICVELDLLPLGVGAVGHLVEDIFDGKMPQLPKNSDAMYALISSMTAYAREHKTEMNRIANSIVYAEHMPPDFSAVLLKDYMYIEDGYKEKLMRIPEFARWLSTKGRLLNGSVK